MYAGGALLDPAAIVGGDATAASYKTGFAGAGGGGVNLNTGADAGTAVSLYPATDAQYGSGAPSAAAASASAASSGPGASSDTAALLASAASDLSWMVQPQPPGGVDPNSAEYAKFYADVYTPWLNRYNAIVAAMTAAGSASGQPSTGQSEDPASGNADATATATTEDGESAPAPAPASASATSEADAGAAEAATATATTTAAESAEADPSTISAKRPADDVAAPVEEEAAAGPAKRTRRKH